jgi:hypothetical protein
MGQKSSSIFPSDKTCPKGPIRGWTVIIFGGHTCYSGAKVQTAVDNKERQREEIFGNGKAKEEARC